MIRLRRMNRIVTLLLVCCLSLCACTSNNNGAVTQEDAGNYKEIVPEFSGLNDNELLRYVEDTIYSEAVNSINSDQYLVENVAAVYVSKEYLQELEFNSKTNVFFGYSLADIEAQFEGTKYVFTVNDVGETVVKPFEAYDDTYEKALKKIAIGTGVILVCVTVSVVTGGAGAPAVSMIFAASAKSGAIMAASSGGIGALSAGIVTGIQTKDFDKAMKLAASAGADAFMWGAIGGSITGGASEAFALKGATLNGLTMNEAAIIQKESKYPIDIIKQFKSVDEFEIYQNAGLKAEMVNGKTALVRTIDLKYKSKLPDGTEVTNLQRMAKGYAPLDPATGKAYQLHHIGQKEDATLAVLTEAEHQGNAAILNTAGKVSEIDRNAFEAVKKAFWKSYAAGFGA